MKTKKDLPSLLGMQINWSKIVAILCIIVIMLTSIMLPMTATLTVASEDIPQTNPVIATINARLEEIRNEGYTIVSYALNIENTNKPNPLGSNQFSNMEQALQDNLDVIVSSVQLKYANDTNTYSFKTEQECSAFVAQIDSIQSQGEYTITKATQEYSTITSTETLATKIADITEAKKQELQRQESIRLAKAKTAVTTSRSGSSLSKGKGSNAVIKNYTYISSKYGTRSRGWHTGVDFATPRGTPIYSWKSGTVTFAGWSGGYGKYIIVDHGNGQMSCYAHCNDIAVSVGQQVSQGQVIGYVGTTGNSTGYHLHFEIKVNGNFVNPLSYL